MERGESCCEEESCTESREGRDPTVPSEVGRQRGGTEGAKGSALGVGRERGTWPAGRGPLEEGAQADDDSEAPFTASLDEQGSGVELEYEYEEDGEEEGAFEDDSSQ